MKQRLIFYLFFFLMMVTGIMHAQSITDSTTFSPGQKDSVIKASQSAAAKPVSQPIDTELVLGRIMLTDATLDLNRTLLQGIQASLDSFNIKSKAVVDEKNIQATIHNMQRQRDKALLTPYLMHMQDSLKTEIQKEEQEKTALEVMLYGKTPKPVLPVETVTKDTTQNIVAKDSTVHVEALAVPPPTRQTTTKHTKKGTKQNNAEPKQTVAPDKTYANSVSFDSLHIRPVIEGGSAGRVDTSVIPVTHWETARALYDNEDTANEERTMHEVVDTQSLQNSRDSSAYRPSGDNGVAANQPVMSDSLRHIKAQLYWTRAMKASNEKNYKIAAEDLKKAIDLLPSYYDAWFSLGEVDAHLGLYSKALNEFKTCAGIDSSKASLYCKMGNILLTLGKKETAEANFNRSLSLDSNYVKAIMGRATIFTDRKQYKTAVDEYVKVLNIDRGYHVAYRAKAMAEYQLKRYDAAIDDYTRFLIFDESDASVYYFRGLSKIGLNQQMDGCADFAFSAKLGYKPALKAMEIHCN